MKIKTEKVKNGTKKCQKVTRCDGGGKKINKRFNFNHPTILCDPKF